MCHALRGFAYLSGATWTEANRSSFDAQAALLHSALDEFAQATDHSELRTIPLAIMGGSRFSEFGAKYAARYRERVLAYVAVVGGNGAAVPGVPALMIVGEEDGGAGTISNSFISTRKNGALVAPALIWGAGHICDRCNDLAWPFFDEVIRARLPAGGAPQGVAEESGWLGDIQTWGNTAPFSDYRGNKQAAAWLFNASFARSWQAFMLKQPLATMTWPTQPYTWANGFSQEPAPLVGGKARAISASRPIDLRASLRQPSSGPFAFYAGDTKIGDGIVSANGATVELKGMRLKPGMYSISVWQNENPVSWPAGLLVLP